MKYFLVVTLFLMGCYVPAYVSDPTPYSGTWVATPADNSTALLILNPSGSAALYTRVGDPWKQIWHGYWLVDNTTIRLLDRNGHPELKLNVMGRGILYFYEPQFTTLPHWFHKYQGAR